MGRRKRRAGGRQGAGPKGSGGGVQKKSSRAADRIEKRRLIVAARRAANQAAKVRAPRHVVIFPMGSASRLEAENYATVIAKQPGGENLIVRPLVPIDIVSALDEMLVADTLILLFGEGERELDMHAVNQLVAVRAQGLPDIICTCLNQAENDDNELRRHRSRVLAAYSLGEEHALRTVNISIVIRKLRERTPKEIAWRKKYGYLAVESIEKDGVITGWLRGNGLDSNGLIHITGVGSFICEKIVDVKTRQVVSVRTKDKGESIESEVVPDSNMGEQTWIPEMEEGGDSFFADGEEDEGEGEDDHMDAEEDGAAMPTMEELMKDDEIPQDNDDEAEEMEVDEDEMARLREQAETDEKFPDEVDTPMDQDARVRFARYRGLKSFRTSEWDPKEQLPRDYASIFQFRDPKSTRKRVLKRAATALSQPPQDNYALPGNRVRIFLAGVSDETRARIEARLQARNIVVASGMLTHENKMSVVHFGVTRCDAEEEAEVIKAKTPMIARVGFATISGRPMFSEGNSNSDKHKMERFLVHDRHTVVSFYGSCVYAPAPVTLFKADTRALVATGTVLGCDPDRIMLKRIVLTGFPFKTQKRKSVIKLMFFSPDDIRWFKPVEIWTKMGRTGNIIEPMGTKGHMKCMFDNSLLHHDTVCMTLYKRVYPKRLEQDAMQPASLY